MPRRRALAIYATFLLPVAFGGCAANAVQAKASPDCIARRDIVSTRILDDRQIDYRLRDGHRLRNTLTASCRYLAYEDRFDYSAASDRVCPGDHIFVPNREWAHGEYVGSTCSLGNFSAAQPGN